jgi:hypothetical protein
MSSVNANWTIHEYAMHTLPTPDWVVVFDSRIPSGILHWDPTTKTARVNQDAIAWTLDQNAGGPILPPNRA